MKRGPKIPRGRLERVEELWLRCIPETKIAAKLAVEFECSRRNVWRYIALVREKLKKTRSTRTPEEERERVESLLSEAEDLARKNEDARAFVQCVRTRSELNSLLGPRRFEVSGPDGGPLQTQAKIVVLPELDTADSVDAEPRPSDALSGEPGVLRVASRGGSAGVAYAVTHEFLERYSSGLVSAVRTVRTQ